MMGQAKQRGTFEERRILAEIKEAELAKLQKLSEAEREANMTDEERSKRQAARLLLSMAAGMGVSI